MSVNNPVDLSLYTQSNPLTMAKDAASIAATQQGLIAGKEDIEKKKRDNLLAGAGMRYNQLLASSIDPETGVVNQNQFLKGLANDPEAAAYGGTDALKTVSEFNKPVEYTDKAGTPRRMTYGQQQQQLTLPEAELHRVHDHFDLVNGVVNNLRAKPNLTIKDINTSIGELVGQFKKSEGKIGMSPQEAAMILKDMPANATSEELHQIVEAKANQFQAMQDAIVGTYGGRPQANAQGIAVGLPAGEVEALTGAATGSSDALNELHQVVGGSGARVFQLKEALDGLKNAPTGPGTETTNRIKSFLLAQEPEFLKKFGITPDELQIADYDKANKYLTQYASGMASNLGQGTDAKLATALSGNASTHISNLAAQDVVKAAIGLERMQQAQAKEFDESGQSPSQYNKWQVQWNKEVDPRAFVLPDLSAEERAKLIKGLSKEERARFASSVRRAVKGGFLVLPGAQ